jgi:hypothetical protein
MARRRRRLGTRRAEVIYPLADQFYGERAGRLGDPFGNLAARSKGAVGRTTLRAPLTSRQLMAVGTQRVRVG